MQGQVLKKTERSFRKKYVTVTEVNRLFTCLFLTISVDKGSDAIINVRYFYAASELEGGQK